MPVVHLTDYAPHAKQRAFHGDPAKYRLLRGAWRSGKTHGLAWEAIHMGMRVAERAGPGATFAVFRHTGPALTDTTQKDILDLVPQEFIVDRHDTQGRADVTLAGGTKILFRAIDDWKKLGGSSFDAIFVDEAWELKLGDFEMLKGRLSGKWGPRRMVLATNPPTRNHWLYDSFVKKKQANMSEHHFSMLDNARNLPEDYVAEHLALKDLNEAKYRRFVLGEWGFTSDNQPVYPEFLESANTGHLEPYRGEGLFLLSGWDFGYRHPAVLWAQLLPTGHLNFLREMMGMGEPIGIFGKRFLQQHELYYPGWPIVHYCDPAGKGKNDMGTSSVLELRKIGIKPRYRQLGLWRTIRMMQALIAQQHFGVRMLRADRRFCPILIEGFLGGYSIDPKTDDPAKDGWYDHLQDAGRYAGAPAIMGGVTIEALPPPPARARVDV